MAKSEAEDTREEAAPAGEEGDESGAQLARASCDDPKELAAYDLTPKMAPFLDRHLIFPMLLFLQDSGMYNQKDVTHARLQLLDATNMIDFASEQYESIGESPPEDADKRREEVLRQLTDSRDHIMKLLTTLENDEEVKKIANKNVEELCREFDVDVEVIDGLVHYAKLQYECGNYNLSCELLKHYRNMVDFEVGFTKDQPVGQSQPQPLINSEPLGSKYFKVYWGLITSYLLTRQFKEAEEVIRELDKFLDHNTKMSKREILLQRAWLLHWTLFAIFTPDKDELENASDKDKVETSLLELFLKESSWSIISLACPHLFRYVGACFILQKRYKHAVKDSVWIFNHESSSYSDPITRFLSALYTDLDFDEAQRELQQCELVCKGDYFLAKHWTDFEENARLLIFETYCRIHQFINIKMIASKLNMEAEDAETWIVKLIRNARLDARIDSEKSRVVMSKAPPSVYQQVIEKTKNAPFRSTMLLSNLEKKERI
mmetsp:Transcript_80268/g.227301  ORF Transcript_80268/g.227301 Transcript_80268/m.227301 type:complete len:490 (+) Transcript_80268:71-1540(+)